eukprot:gnl/MRDRNA2_/MRDRNA2_414463_c0_seq1.p1 gnl/MRDRNA2_/MRDRNA2_414463_c0~~gnl/MRDRNA2_/MRDRNA2_414463_c0_seq1.p1  ORF type:complete len:128 (+),score=21.98 gnl/MRDRNA2_/MRDRNA2_414463_c0_seq1:97-480(+)
MIAGFELPELNASGFNAAEPLEADFSTLEPQGPRTFMTPASIMLFAVLILTMSWILITQSTLSDSEAVNQAVDNAANNSAQATSEAWQRTARRLPRTQPQETSESKHIAAFADGIVLARYKQRTGTN